MKRLFVAMVAVGIAATGGRVRAEPPASSPYVWRHVKIVAGGFVPGIEFSTARKNLIYLRTDMGGAYRWKQDKQRWMPLTDWAGRDDWNRLGIESIAPDPTDADRVYIASGTYVRDWAGDGVVLRSNDRGRTWQRTDMPFKMGGNEEGRSIGERMAVDPNDPRIIYLGSRHDGLWRSEDSGVTWSKVASFPFAGERDGIGVGFVLFDSLGRSHISNLKFEISDPKSETRNDPRSKSEIPNPKSEIRNSPHPGPPPGYQERGLRRPTRVIYVGVEDGDTHLYRSGDAGKTWSAIPGEPAGMIPHHAVIAPDGLIYSTWCNGPGPNGVTSGSVFVYNTATRKWTDISPIKPDESHTFGFDGLTVDAQHPRTIMVATLDRWSQGDDIFRSIDGGKTWKSLKKHSVRDVSLSPYLHWGKRYVRVGHWIGALEIDPFDSDHVLYATGATIYGTHDMTAMDRDQVTHWEVAAEGVEQTAVMDLISPPVGPHLISALGDLGGFRHDRLNISPKRGMFEHPLFITCTSLDYAQDEPNLVVRVGSGPAAHGAYSTDIGRTWKPFASEPAGAESGTIAISADGKTIVWAPRHRPMNYSTDLGASWQRCKGLRAGETVISDRIDSNIFYAMGKGGTIEISTDGGRTFSAGARDLPEPASRVRAWPDHAGWVLLPSHEGLYESRDGGKTFFRMSGVQEADAVGFGKSAPDSTELTLFLSGKVGGTNGVFRSTDGGQTWKRINDKAHGYGVITPITGDPRIFGRVYLGTNGRGIVYGDAAQD